MCPQSYEVRRGEAMAQSLIPNKNASAGENRWRMLLSLPPGSDEPCARSADSNAIQINAIFTPRGAAPSTVQLGLRGGFPALARDRRKLKTPRRLRPVIQDALKHRKQRAHCLQCPRSAAQSEFCSYNDALR
jgi:hypothetical protein